MFCLGNLTYHVMLQVFEYGCKWICFVVTSNVHDAFVGIFVCLFAYLCVWGGFCLFVSSFVVVFF